MPSPFNKCDFNNLRSDEKVASATQAFLAWLASLFSGPGDGPPDPDPGMGAMVMCMCMGPCEEAPGRRRGGAMGRNAGCFADPLGLCDVPCEADIREPVHRSAGTGVRGPLSTTRAVLEDMIPVPSASTPRPPPCTPILRTEELRGPEPAPDTRTVSSSGKDGNAVRAAVEDPATQLAEPGTAREVNSVSCGEPGGWGIICEGVPEEDDTDCESVVGEDSVKASPDNGEMNEPPDVPPVTATRT